MNVEKLSERLTRVAHYIPTGARLADIGSDHAYLPCHVVKKGLVPFAIAGEVVEGPFLSAQKQVRAEGLTKQIEVRKGNGLAVLAPGEVDCITIAGMGGALIATILEEGLDKLEGVSRLVLQPNISAISIRTWLLNHHWRIIQEDIIEEDQKIYEILIAERGNAKEPYEEEELEAQLLLGPILSIQRSSVFEKKWRGEVANWQRIISQIEKSPQSGENQAKLVELQKKIQMVEEVLAR